MTQPKISILQKISSFLDEIAYAILQSDPEVAKMLAERKARQESIIALVAEYKAINDKDSNLSKSRRDFIESQFNSLVESGEIRINFV